MRLQRRRLPTSSIGNIRLNLHVFFGTSTICPIYKYGIPHLYIGQIMVEISW